MQYGLGLPSENQAALNAGNRHHARKAIAERVAGGTTGVGRMLIAIVLVMSVPAGWIALAAVLALLLGLWLKLAGRGMRQRRGLGAATASGPPGSPTT